MVRKETDGAVADFAVSGLSSGLLAAQNTAGNSARAGFMERIQRKTSQR